MRMEPILSCPVCNAERFYELLQTPAHMHHGHERFSFSCCQVCTAVFLNPRVQESHLQSYYPSTYLPYRGAVAWGKFGRFVEGSQRKMDDRRAKRCLSYVEPQKSISLLDVGCGRPTFLETLRRQTDWLLTGIDFSADGWGDVEPAGMTLLEADVQNLSFNGALIGASNSASSAASNTASSSASDTAASSASSSASNGPFELVTMWHYLEHDYRPQKTIEAVRSIMPKGGKLIIEVPDYLSWTARWQKEYWEGWHAPRHTVLYSQQSLTHLLQQHGFNVIDAVRYGTLDAFTLWWMGVMEKRGIDWRQSMEPEFIPLMWRMIYTAPLFLCEKFVPLGIQTVVAEAV